MPRGLPPLAQVDRGAFCSLALATTDITLGRRLTTDFVRPELDRCRVRAVIQSPLRDAEDAGSERAQAVGLDPKTKEGYLRSPRLIEVRFVLSLSLSRPLTSR
jgi:hypothetical protein